MTRIDKVTAADTTADTLRPLMAAALKSLARGDAYRSAFRDSPLLRQTLEGPASRYVAKDRSDFVKRARGLSTRGYLVGAELVGEGTTDPHQIALIEAEYLTLIDALANFPDPRPTINFDLSNLGLATNERLAIRTLHTIAEKAADRGITVVLSMEGADLVDQILRVYRTVKAHVPSLGLTVQAFRPRTVDDLASLLDAGARLRLVKGVYDEPADSILPRGTALNRRFIDLAHRILQAGCPLQVATHDADLIGSLLADKISSNVEFEMLHGVRPDLAGQLRARGFPVRIYTTYGPNFWLHFLHRLAEHPENLAIALADWAAPHRLAEEMYQ